MKSRSNVSLATVVASAGLLAAGMTSAKATYIIDVTTPPSSAPLIGHIAGASNPKADDIQPLVNTYLGGAIGSIGTLLYKANNDGSEDGTLENSYSASPSSWNSLPSSAPPIVISFGSGNFASPATVLLVKDGDLGTYVFDIRTWDGTEPISVNNLFDPDKTITGTSHVEFWGSRSTTVVPEPSTYIAGGLALVPLLFGLRSRLAKKA